MKTKIADLVQRHIALSVIGPSAARKLLQKGQIVNVREFLNALTIEQFGDPSRFSFGLNSATQDMTKQLPVSWGAARKFLNLYVRELSYNFYVRKEYELGRTEHLLELPLDRFAAQGLRDDAIGLNLEGAVPRWDGVIHLTPEVSDQFQSAAATVAARRSISRVHLDLIYWRRESHEALPG